MNTKSVLLLLMMMAAALLQGCNRLDKTISEAVDDGKIEREEAEMIIEAFEEDGTYFQENDSLDQKRILAYVMKIAEKDGVEIDKESVREALFGATPQPQKPISVSVYLDNTLSMKGYAMAKNAEAFTSVFAGINHYYSAKSNVNKCGYYVGRNGIERIDFAKLLSQLTHKEVPFTDSYQLDGFMGIVCRQVAKEDADAICFFVTDGIPSGTNEEIRTNQRFNLDNRAILKTRIADSLRPLSDGSHAIAIYGFAAGFNGIYYNYKNTHVQTGTNDINRPFYVIALGKRELVNEFHESVVAGLQDFSPLHKVLFAKGDGLRKPQFSDIDYEDTDKNFSKDTLYVRQDSDQRIMNVGFYFKKESFPSCVKDDLDSVISIEYGNESVDFSVDGDRVKFTLPLLGAEYGKELRIRVKDELPGWVNDKNTTTDEKFTTKNPERTTLNLAVLVQAVHDGIFNDSGRVYCVDKKFMVTVADESKD